MEKKAISQADVFNLITNRIISQLEANIVPWQQPWIDAGLPRNLVTMKPYSGINVWLLAMLKYPRNYFLTYKQIHDLGGSVIKGEKSCPVVFWKYSEKEDSETKEVKKTSMIRYYTVFNIDQCTGIPEGKVPVNASTKIDPIEECDAIINSMTNPPIIESVQNQAFYNPVKDIINMPPMENFVSSEAYYMTLFHEMTHWTGHSSRLNRKEVIEKTGFGTKDYSMEELVAELGACYLKSFTGIADFEFNNSVSYIQGWLKKLRDDKKFIVYASAKAQKAVDYILEIPLENDKRVE